MVRIPQLEPRDSRWPGSKQLWEDLDCFTCTSLGRFGSLPYGCMGGGPVRLGIIRFGARRLKTRQARRRSAVASERRGRRQQVPLQSHPPQARRPAQCGKAAAADSSCRARSTRQCAHPPSPASKNRLPIATSNAPGPRAPGVRHLYKTTLRTLEDRGKRAGGPSRSSCPALS